MSNSNQCDNVEDSVCLSIDIQGQEANVKLIAHAANFHARGSAYFALDNLVSRINLFSQFPICRDTAPSIIGGYLSDSGSEVIEEHVHISVIPANSAGALIMTVKAFSPDFEYLGRGFGKGGRCDYKLSYEGLSSFANLFGKLVNGDVEKITFSEFL